MKESLSDGLQIAFNAFKKLPFPDNTFEDDRLSDLFSELAEIDSYYAGLVSSLLTTSRGEIIETEKLDEFMDKLASAKDGTANEAAYQCVLKYAKAIESLVVAANDSINTSS